MSAKRKSASKDRASVKSEASSQPAGAMSVVLARRAWVAMLALVVAILAAYANSLHGPFIFDDGPSIVDNPSIRSLSFPRVLVAPPETVAAPGRPVLNLSLALNYAVGGLAVEGYHLVNLALHILTALALFALVRRTLLVPRLAERYGSAATGWALSVALLWAIHPLQTESVTYIIQRAEALVGLFYLLTLYCFLRGATAANGRAWYLAAVVACALGMASKEVMATAPLVAILYDRTFVAGSFKESLRRRWRLWLALAATWGLLAFCYHLSQDRGGSTGFSAGMSSWQYARTQFGCIIRYLRLVFWPDPLVLDYGQRIAHGAMEIVPYALAVLVLLGATLVALVLRPMWGFLGMWFFIILAPSSSIVPLTGQTENEHRMYLPLAAVVAALVFAIHAALLRWGPRFRRAAVALLVLVALALGWRTHRRNQDYQSEMVIWEATLREVPANHRAYLTRGSLYWSMGRFDAALEDYNRSIELNPRNAKAHIGRGHVLSERGQHEQALRDYEAAIALDPKLADAYDGRGSEMLKKGHIDEAIRDFDKAIALDPEFANAYLNRARAHDGKRELDAAIQDYGVVIRLRPDFALAFSNRCGALVNKGQSEAAIRDCDRAIELRPDLPEAYNNRGNAQQGRGRLAEAIKDYDKAIELWPDFVAAYQNRAMAHARTQAYDQAWADVRMVSKLGGTPMPRFVEDLRKKSGQMGETEGATTERTEGGGGR